MLCSHIYIKVYRTVRNNAQIIEESEELIEIFEDKIITASERFDLKDILDISFKKISAKNGFLYLHTTSGLYSYVTETNPHKLIKIYKDLKKRN